MNFWLSYFAWPKTPPVNCSKVTFPQSTLQDDSWVSGGELWVVLICICSIYPAGRLLECLTRTNRVQCPVIWSQQGDMKESRSGSGVSVLWQCLNYQDHYHQLYQYWEPVWSLKSVVWASGERSDLLGGPTWTDWLGLTLTTLHLGKSLSRHGRRAWRVERPEVQYLVILS